MGGDALGGGASLPQIGVSWFDANEYLCALNQMTGRAYRLATDAEWEFAARGGRLGVESEHRNSGSDDADEVAWHSGNSGGVAHEVGTKAANLLGVHDMSGNAWEWVFDWLVPYTDTAKQDPVQLFGSGNKTRRGGDFGEPAAFARVSRRAIRSRDGAAGMGFRIAHSNTIPSGIPSPCEAAHPMGLSCSGDTERDCRLTTSEDEVWEGDGNVLIVRADGRAALSGYPGAAGQWYTLNDRSFNIVSSSGQVETLAYYVFSESELTMISGAGMPYRLYRRALSDVTAALPNLPVASTSTLAELLDDVAPANWVTPEQLVAPNKNERDARLIPEGGRTWFMDGRCCSGNHKYRFELRADGSAEFVVMDYDDTQRENVLARGSWFTSGNIALHLEFEGGYYNYLYTLGQREQALGEYMPAGPIYSHISFQDYERGDFRIFSRYPLDAQVQRERGPLGDAPVYEPGEYRATSGRGGD